MRATSRLPGIWPALAATVLLLIGLLGAYSLIESRRLERNLSRELEERALALIGVLEASSRNAIASNALLEDLVSQRLLDNARFVDFLVARTPRAQELITRLASENRLARVELLDRAGQPIQLPQPEGLMGGPGGGRWGPGGPGRSGSGSAPELEAPGPTQGPGRWPHRMMGSGMMGMGRMMGLPEETPGQPGYGRRAAGMPFMWGHRWGGPRGDPGQLFPSLPKDAKIRRFWEGSAFGVAVPAQSFKGIIAVHADADYLLHFRREIGVERLIQDLGKQAGIAEVTLLDRHYTVLASSDPAAVGRQDQDPLLRVAWDASALRAGRASREGGAEVYEVVKPFALENKQVGLVRLGLGTAGLAELAGQTRRSILFYSLGLLVVGVLGAAAIFWIQARGLVERRALEAAVAQEQRLAAVGNLAAGVAHEIRNPLNAISVGLQRLRREFAPAGTEARTEYERFLEILRGEVGRLNAIVSQFLSLARPARLTLTEAPLAPVLQDLATLLESQASAQHVRIVQQLDLAGATVRMDKPQLTQAFMNLMLNALQAMPGGGAVTIQASLASAGPTARVTVSDTGPGVPAKHLDRIFEPYFTTKEGGTGLGLALARKIVEEHQGTIRAENSPGGGAIFLVTLPVVAERQAP
jgi:signal transduction histidine kinase